MRRESGREREGRRSICRERKGESEGGAFAERGRAREREREREYLQIERERSICRERGDFLRVEKRHARERKRPSEDEQ